MENANPTTAVDAELLPYPTKDLSRPYVVTPEKLAEWEATFPAVAVQRELRVAWQWCRENVSKRKTYGATAAFLANWLTRAYRQMSQTSSEPELPYQRPYRELERRGGGYLRLLRSRYTDGDLSDQELLIRSAQDEVLLCHRCHIAYDLDHMRATLARYLSSEAGVANREATLLAQTSLNRQF